jgi:two-component system, chemotaxis family, CheB/CheR fusion protein
MTIFHRKLQLLEPTSPRGLRHPIDFFFRTLAEDVRENAIGIVLSGTGTEGTQGIRDIKGEGGLVVVQDPKSAKFDFMPRSAISTDLVDYILTPEQMPDYLIRYTRQARTGVIRIQAEDKKIDHASLQKIFVIIRSRTGNDFSMYKPNTLIRRIERRMILHQISNIDHYIKFLQSEPDEVNKLNKDFLIGVTFFFRNCEIFDYIKSELLPDLFRNKSDEESFRIWVPGCSTGEEAYSHAIIIREYLNEANLNFRVQIFATDLDNDAIKKARTGLYSESISVDVSPERLGKFFTKTHNFYKISDEIRSTVIFAPHNIITDPPFFHLDMLSCRNLLIYLNHEIQNHLMQVFHHSLKPEGVLFLGSSENIGSNFDLFSVVNKKHGLYRQKPGTGTLDNVKNFKNFTRRNRKIDQKKNKKLEVPDYVYSQNIEKNVEKLILSDYSPSCAVINEKGDILYLHGRTGKYLEPAQGKAHLNIFSMARQGVKHELNIAVRKALSEKREIIFENLPVRTNGDIQQIDLIVKPIPDSPALQDLLLVVFRDTRACKPQVCGENSPDITEKEVHDQIKLLEQEMSKTRERLQNTIEEMDSSEEDYKSAIEELQSTNEELQSTNEELETSKEELQAVNEELITVNAELQGKIDELTSVNDDMNNLFASTDIATIFLNNELQIKRFTPAITKIIKLIPTDIGRSIGDLKSNLSDEDLVKDISEVIDTLAFKIREVQDTNGSWYLMRILPYRTSRNVIDGAVITFSDITTVKKLEKEVLERETKYRALFDSAIDGIVLVDINTGQIMECNLEFERQTGRTEDQLKTMKIWELALPQKIKTEKDEFTKTNFNKIISQRETQFRRPDDTTVEIELRTAPVQTDSQFHLQFFTRDITKQKKITDSLRKAQDLSESVFQTVREPLVALDNNLDITAVNRSFMQSLKIENGDITGKNIFEIAGGVFQTQNLKKLLEQLLSTSTQVQDHKIEIVSSEFGKKVYMLNARPLERTGEQARGILIALEEAIQ